jgi:hypothetical protein
MKINDNNIVFLDNSGDIYYTNHMDKTIKLGEFKFKPEYGSVEIKLGNICRVYAEFFKSEYDMPMKYWFESQYVCSLVHGRTCRDDEWVFDLFDQVTPYTDEINGLLKQFIRAAFTKAQSFNAKEVA